MDTTEISDEVVLRRLRDYCDYVLSSLNRVDQRRWGEAYIRGLLFCEGRRSIKRIAAHVGGCSDQSLQQFVNQSPWDPEPVRRRLATALARALEPTAWVLEEVAFAKHGRQSAAIERQFVPSQGRVRNCQLGAVAMLASDKAAVAVNWRLAIPRTWDSDAGRRRSAHVPAGERYQPYWRYHVDMLDDLSGDWGIPLVPVLVDARQCEATDQLVGELDSRGLEYLVRVSGNTTTRHRAAPREDGTGSPRPLNGHQVDGRPAVSAPAQPALPKRTTVAWHPPTLPHPVRSQFATVPAGTRQRPAAQSMLLEWRLGGATPRAWWLTNMTDRTAGELGTLTKIAPKAKHDLDNLTESVGLGHHEGRSFGGWHHHVTLVSVAQSFKILHDLHRQGPPSVPAGHSVNSPLPGTDIRA
jgi:SRSO17 transposase